MPAFGEIRWIDVGAGVRDVAASPRRIAAVIEDGTIVTFDLASGARTTARPADAIAVPGMLSLSPDGSYLAVCVGTEVSVIELSHGTYGIAFDDVPCDAPALWSPDGTRLYAVGHGGELAAFDVATGPVPTRARHLEGPTFVMADGSIVSESDHHVLVMDAAMTTIASYTLPDLGAQHGSPGTSFLLELVDPTTIVYACGDDSYDVALVHAGVLEGAAWQTSQTERWRSAVPLDGERAWIVVQRDDGNLARVVRTRTGESLLEVPDVTELSSVSADRSTAAAVVETRIAVIGLN